MPPLEQVNNATRIALLSLALSAVALIVVLFIAARPTPQAVAPLPTATPAATDNTAALMAELEDLRVQVATLQQSVVDTQSLVRAVMERGGGTGQPTPAAGNPDQISQRLDRLEASLASVAGKLDAICGAIQSSAFAPSGFACP